MLCSDSDELSLRLGPGKVEVNFVCRYYYDDYTDAGGLTMQLSYGGSTRPVWSWSDEDRSWLDLDKASKLLTASKIKSWSSPTDHGTIYNVAGSSQSQLRPQAADGTSPLAAPEPAGADSDSEEGEGGDSEQADDHSGNEEGAGSGDENEDDDRRHARGEVIWRSLSPERGRLAFRFMHDLAHAIFEIVQEQGGFSSDYNVKDVDYGTFEAAFGQP